MLKRTFTLEGMDGKFDAAKKVAISHFHVNPDSAVWVVSFCFPRWSSVANARVFKSEDPAKDFIRNHLFGKMIEMLDTDSVNVSYQNIAE